MHPKPTVYAALSASVLSVSPVEGDPVELDVIFHKAARLAPVEARWHLSRTGTLASARAALKRAEYAVVLCESDLQPGSWKDLLQSTETLSNPPFVIVTSRLADEYLWAEALNMGAYDVLAKPFYTAEVIRVVNSACLRWQRERQYLPAKSESRFRSLTAGGMVQCG
jgi:DNA-binding NtrC family response regulator